MNINEISICKNDIKFLLRNISKPNAQRCLFGNVLIFAVAIINLSISGNINASDAKVFPGSHCKATSSTYSDSLYNYNLGILNMSSRNAYVTCPITRDNTVNKNGILGSYLYVYQSSNTSSRFVCTLSSHSSQTNATNDSHTVSLPSSKTGNQYLSLNLGKSAIYGTYVLNCKVPPGSRIKSLYVREY